MDVKRALYGTGTAGALVSAFLAGSVILRPAWAQTASPTPATSQQGQQREQDDDDANERAVQTALQSQAKISADQAKQVGLAQFPGGTIREIELKKTRGTLVYEIEVVDSAGKTHEVTVDATTGQVLASAPDEDDDNEGPETDDD